MACLSSLKTFPVAVVASCRMGLFATIVTANLFAQEAPVTVTPATLPLQDGTKVVLQGVRRYFERGRSPATEALSAGYLRPVTARLDPAFPPTAYIVAQDAEPTEANVFTVTVVPPPAGLPWASSFSPDFQLVAFRAADGNYLGFNEGDELGAIMGSADFAQLFVIDRGEPFRIFVAPVDLGHARILLTQPWRNIPGSQLVFWRIKDFTMWRPVSLPRETTAQAGPVRLYRVQPKAE